MDSRFCFIQATSRWMRRGFTATIALAASLFIVMPATAGTTLHEDSQFKVDLQAFVANFSIWAEGAGAGAGGGSATVTEFIMEPQLDLTWNTGAGEIYSRISWGFGSTHGEYEDFGWYFNLAEDSDNISSRREWLNLGYRNDLFDLSVGAQDVFIGTGLIVGDGYANDGKHGAYFFGLQKTFRNTALVRINEIGDTGFRSDIFWLDAEGSRESVERRVGAVREETHGVEAAAINVEYDASRLPGLSGGTLGAMYLEVLYASRNNPKRAILDGREYYDFRAEGVVFDTLPNWKFSGEIALQDGSVDDCPAGSPCEFDAYVWYAAGDYTFIDVPWTPRIGYRYYEASGDDNPTDNKIEQHESLFYTGAAGWETWFQGQIWGEFVSLQENQRTHLVRGRIFPADTYSFSAHYVRNEPDVGGAGFDSGDSYLDEINLFAEYYKGSFYVALIMSYGWIGNETAFEGFTGFDSDDGDLKSAFVWMQHTF